MPSSRALRQVYADLLAKYGRQVADAFMKAVDDLRTGVELQRLQAAIEQRNIEAALEALNIDLAVYDEMLNRIRDAHTAGGQSATDTFPKRKPDGTALVMRFDGRNPRAEAWLSRNSSTLVTRIVSDQRAAVRASLAAGMERGDNPRQTALDIVGRVNRVTGRREGGVLGLSVPQEQYVRSARDELASDAPAGLRNYLGRKRRDKRFDRSVTKAIREGTTVPPEIAAKAATAYERRLLQLRGEVIGKHETFTAIANGKHEAFEQAVESGKVPLAAVTKAWHWFSNLDPRHQHQAMNGKKVGLREAFILPDGTVMQYPHDPSAPIGQTAGCHCQGDYEIDFLFGIR